MNTIPNTLSNQEPQNVSKLIGTGKQLTVGGNTKTEFQTGMGYEWHPGGKKSSGGESQNGGDIVTENNSSRFDLQFEFRPPKVPTAGEIFVTEKEGNTGSGHWP